MGLNLDSVRKQFPVLRKCIYANTATSGLMYEDLLEWCQEHDLDFLLGGAKMKMASMASLGEVKKTIAEFFYCDLSGVSLVPNFSIGFNFLLEGLDRKNNVLLLNSEYPSVDWPVEDRGFTCFYASIGADLEDRIVDCVNKNQIDVLVLSLVQWKDGFFVAPEFLKQLKADFPNLIILADGTQYCGMYACNFKESGIDVLGTSGYKWLLGGYGNGFFLFSNAAKERFDLKSVGCGSVNGDPTKRDSIPFKKRLEPGHLDSLNFGSLKFSLEYLQRLGMENITKHNKTLSKKAFETFHALGLLKTHIAERKTHSTIFNLDLSAQQHQKLVQHNVDCAQRGGGTRISLHFYNNFDDLSKIQSALEAIL